MNIQHLFLSSLLLLLLHHLHAQPNITGYTCSPNPSIYPCQTYVSYRAMAPYFLDLANISDLFSVSRLMITNPSNISSPTSPLVPDQSLLIPITCSCNSNYNLSYSNLTYTIKQDDTFYLVSTNHFQNLTTYQSVQLVNPTLTPTLLEIGFQVIFPIFYTLSSIAAKFGSNPQLLIDINGEKISPFDTVFVPVSRIPNITQPSVVLPVPSKSTERKGVVVGLAIGLGVSGFLLILLILVMGFRFYKEYWRKNEEEEKEKQHQFRRAKSLNEENLMADVSDCLDKYRVYGIQDLREATAGFSQSSLIQGSVYKGCIGGEFYAIKRMKWNACEELKILQKVNHGNLVKLEGFSIDPKDGNCYLVYEYVENGSLYSWLHEDNGVKKKLDWKTRLRIAIDVANGLQYIHEHTRPTVVHKDIKTSNILLDGNMRAKIANFGLAKSGCNAITMNIVGTQGYIAPEYLEDGIVTTKMDVFAFGVVLLEIISGKEAIDEEGKALWTDVNRVLEGREDEKYERLKNWMDLALVGESCTLESVRNVLAVAIACLQREPSRRPNMVDVVYTLCKSDDLYLDFSEDGLSVTPVSAR
ncbi:Protein kinase domain [Macleaya cordata]|uniref:Protein kinase domain n=1 Tax=Macleaya cordata TaxID=56857 RepID=A0A200PSL9_MACCD|nr:Protein kinase domain [Macleaya cordata]